MGDQPAREIFLRNTLTDILFITVRSRECERYSRSVADAGVLSKARAQGGNLFGHLQICRD